jgi:hypothetical protein
MSTIITKAERPAFASDYLKGGAPDEKQTAYDTCISYAGRFEIEGDIVYHHIQASLFPNWIASDQRRLIAFDGEELILSSQPILTDGVGWVYQARWRRAGRTDAISSPNQDVHEVGAL